MRIGLDVSQSAYEGTGSGRYVIELVKGLLRLPEAQEYVLFGSARKRKDVLLSLSRDYRETNTNHTLEEHYFSFPPSFFELIWNDWHHVPIERFVGPLDIYHSSDWTQAPSRAKKVTTVHDLIPFLFPQYVHPRIRKAHESRWNYIVKENIAIIADAESTKRDILETFAVSESNVYVIPLACNAGYFTVGAERLADAKSPKYIEICDELMKRFELTEKKYILAVGTLEPRKNIKRLVEAYQSLDKDLREEYKLVIVGKKAWAEEFPFAAGVVFTGYVEESDLPYLYGCSNCFVMPSLYEGFGIPVLEAMACGTPVICSERSSLPEIGGDDVHYIAEPEEVENIRIVMQHVLESEEEELKQVARSAYARTKQFSWERTARETLEVYKGL